MFKKIIFITPILIITIKSGETKVRLIMKGIILAGGAGTRLYPITKVMSKQLLPVYDKPMIYYPLSVLMLSEIRQILIITTPEDSSRFQDLLGDGSQWGINLSYAEQPKPEGLAQAFIIGRDFVGQDRVCLILGDNIFYGHGLPAIYQRAVKKTHGATIFGYWVRNPEHYGVAVFDNKGQVMDIEEKPSESKSHYAITGLYFYDNQVLDIAATLKPSARGELEITDVNRAYLQRKILHLERLGRGVAWLDMGTCKTLMQAASFIEAIEQRQGLKIACLEEIALQMGYISLADVEKLAAPFVNSEYGQYLIRLVQMGGPFL